MSKWKFEPCETEDGRATTSADIIMPNGKSIFSVDLGDFFGISTKTAEKIVNLLNERTNRK